MKTAESAKKYAPIFREAGFSALDYNFDPFFYGADVSGGKNFELLDRPREEYLAYFKEIADIIHENGLVIGQTHAHFSTLIAMGSKERNEYLLELLKKEALSAGEIGSHFDMTGATISYHLSILKKAGLVTETKKKNFIYYELNTSVLEEVMLWLAELRGISDVEGT
jgi:DNA-binding transcriptional ArsR family regulator